MSSILVEDSPSLVLRAHHLENLGLRSNRSYHQLMCTKSTQPAMPFVDLGLGRLLKEKQFIFLGDSALPQPLLYHHF